MGHGHFLVAESVPVVLGGGVQRVLPVVGGCILALDKGCVEEREEVHQLVEAAAGADALAKDVIVPDEVAVYEVFQHVAEMAVVGDLQLLGNFLAGEAFLGVGQEFDDGFVALRGLEEGLVEALILTAELGTIGTMEGNEIHYTQPDEAKAFVEATGVDTLAVAIGTRHGLYPKGLTPHLELGLLRELREAVEIPLVLHGGSDNPDSEIEQACLIGISKINISSDIKKAFYVKCREVLADESLREPNAIYPPCIEEMKKVMRHKFRLFHADGKAALY